MGKTFGAEQANTTALQVVLPLESSAVLPACCTICSALTTFLILVIIANIARFLPKSTAPTRHQPPTTPATSAIISSFSIPTTNKGTLRGAARATASPTTSGQSPKSPGASQAQANSASASGSGRRRAVLIGLNYSRYGNDLGEVRPLRHAALDARRFADSLTRLGYSSEDVRVVTDKDDQPFPSRAHLIECMDWLVRDATEGDRLFFMFSGHCEPGKIGKPEPHLVAADLMGITRSTFQERLVKKIPAGAELTIVLDCCNASDMVELKYCIGRTEYEGASKNGPKSPPSL